MSLEGQVSTGQEPAVGTVGWALGQGHGRREQSPRGKREQALLRDLHVIRFRWSRAGREMEEGVRERVGRSQTPESLQTMLRSWEMESCRQICLSVKNSLGRQ